MIRTGQELLYPEPVRASGVLWIGDPHVGSARPGRRTDGDWPGAIMRKLSHAIAHANEHRLVPVFLGDMYDQPVERDEGLKTRLIRILKSSWMVPVSNVGNHDKANAVLSDDDSLASLGVSDVLDVVRDGGPVLVIDTGERVYGIGMTPYGSDIPTDVTGTFAGHAVDGIVWATHHDIEFAGAYPGAVPPFHIEGCEMVVNGHIHLTKPKRVAGGTTWHNPGNINRLSVDTRSHVPCAWAMSPGRFDAVPLPHATDAFDMSGYNVRPARPEEVAASHEPASAFAELLDDEASTEMGRSMDGSVIREVIDAKYARDETAPGIRAVIDSLLGEAVEKARAA